MSTAEKRTLSLADLDAQAALELPNRDTLALVNVVVTNVLNNLSVSVPVQNNHVGVEVCAVVSALNSVLVNTATSAPTASLTCSLTTG
jgi:hypothetical protein